MARGYPVGVRLSQYAMPEGQQDKGSGLVFLTGHWTSVGGDHGKIPLPPVDPCRGLISVMMILREPS